ncbi:MCE family protein [bacterium]|nr:MCE family protein [bacterium]
MKEKNKNKDGVLHITHAGEFLFWLVVICIIVAFSSLGLIFKEKHDENDYQIFLQDVDGLIIGSPVRMLGIEVGHITKIKPLNDEAYVKFIITNPDVYIPQGTVATVEFSGLAGSKSLELYLPQKGDYIDSSTPLLAVESPKRLHDAMGLLNDMFKKLGSIMYTTSHFGTELQEHDIMPTHFVKPSNDNIKEFLIYSDKFLDDSNKKANEIRNSLGGLKKDAK